MIFDNLILCEFTSCMNSIPYYENNKINVYATKQPVKILLFKLKQKFYFCRFVKILTMVRPWYTTYLEVTKIDLKVVQKKMRYLL